MLVDALRQVGLVPNAWKTKMFNDAEPASSKTCSARRDKSVPISQRSAYFDAMVTPVATYTAECFRQVMANNPNWNIGTQ